LKKILLIITLSVVVISCGNQDPHDQLGYLDGYWEIEKVTLADGTEKEFSISTTVDFIEVSGMQGVRTKVNPKLDGSFVANPTTETFRIAVEDDSLRLYYSTPYDSWKETVLKAKDSSLVVLNSDGKVYFYKKFAKFNFD